jgi:hypothetical protein
MGWCCFNLFRTSLLRNVLFRERMRLSPIFLQMSSSSHCSFTISHSAILTKKVHVGKSDGARCAKAVGHAAGSGKVMLSTSTNLLNIMLPWP